AKQLAFESAAPSAADDEAETLEQTYTVEVSGKRFDVKVIGAAPAYAAAPVAANGAGAGRRAPRRDRASAGGASGGDTLASPLQGTILRVAVQAGAVVEEGALIAVIEAMKMENEITAHKSGTVAEL